MDIFGKISNLMYSHIYVLILENHDVTFIEDRIKDMMCVYSVHRAHAWCDLFKVIWTYLDIARPFFRIYNSENGTLEDQHYHRGSKIGLQCEVKIKRIVAKFSIWLKSRLGGRHFKIHLSSGFSRWEVSWRSTKVIEIGCHAMHSICHVQICASGHSLEFVGWRPRIIQI